MSQPLKIPLISMTPPPAAPKTLGEKGREFWKTATESRQFEGHDLAVLESACKLLDRAQQAADRVKADGAFVADRFGQFVPHRGIEVERSSLVAFERMRRALNLDCKKEPSLGLKPLKKNLRGGYR